VTILERHETGATVLVDYEQLADLARLRFHPRNSEEFGALVTAGAEEKPWLARSLRGLSEQAQTLRSEIESPLEAMSAQTRYTTAALMTLRAAAQSLGIDAVMYSPDETTTIGNNIDPQYICRCYKDNPIALSAGRPARF
jgi:hypothetical protein